MADTKITDLAAITSGVASTDVTVLVDVSDTSMAASGTDKKITVGDLATAIVSAGGLATDAEVTAAVAAHTGDTSAAHAASAISFSATGSIAATDVQAAVAEVATDAATALSTHESDTTSVHGIADTSALLTSSSGIDALSDVTITAAASGDILRHNGTAWVDAVGTTHFEAAGGIATHAALTSSVHGISTFGASLVDDADASAARTTLGLGSLATASTITSSSVTDFAETVRDTMGTALVAGSNVTITVNDGADTITIASSGGGVTLSERGQLSGYDSVTAYYAVPGVSGTAHGTATLTADRLYYSLFVVDRDITINTAAVNVSTAAGTVLRIGIVRLDASDRQPNATGLVWQTTVSPASTGVKTATGLSIALTAGIYASLVVADAGPVVSQISTTAAIAGQFRFAANIVPGWTERSSVGTTAFADPVPDWTGINASNSTLHFVGYRWS